MLLFVDLRSDKSPGATPQFLRRGIFFFCFFSRPFIFVAAIYFALHGIAKFCASR